MDDKQAPAAASWRYLYREEAGRIDAVTWWRGTLLLVTLLAVLTLGLAFVLPHVEHDLSKTPLLSPWAFGANLYVLIYTFALILIGICHYNLSAKRWRDRGRPAALAGLLPFLAFLSGALHWLASQVGAALPPATTIAADILLVVILFWNIIDLGGLAPASRRQD